MVEPGLAIDGCGRQILVFRKRRSSCQTTFETANRWRRVQAGIIGGGTQSRQQNPGVENEQQEDFSERECPEMPDKCQSESDLYICIRYTECEAELTPAPFNECASTGNSMKPNRICEGFTLEWLVNEPEDWEQIRKWKSESHG